MLFVKYSSYNLLGGGGEQQIEAHYVTQNSILFKRCDMCFCVHNIFLNVDRLSDGIL